MHGFPVAGSGVHYRAVCCPEAERLCREETLWLSQSALLDERGDMDDVVAALLKIKEHAGELLTASVP